MTQKVKKIKLQSSLRVLGVMTGSSCDGLDAACIEITPKGWRSLWSATVQYPVHLRKKVLLFQLPKSIHPIHKIMELHRDLGIWYGSALKQILASQKETPDLIANHGQTLAHFPGTHGGGTTLQLGDPTYITIATGLSVVSHFREGDLAAGGQGAPLVPLFHKVLIKKLKNSQLGISIHNIGGMSNLTYLGPDDNLLAFDTGPGNIWIDAAAEKVSQGKRKMDRNGRMARNGRIDTLGLQAILKHPYFKQSIPKSTGRDDFPFEFLLSRTKAKGDSLVATATELTVESIARSYEEWILKKKLPLNSIFLCGGGAKNKTLCTRLQMRLPQLRILTLDEVGMNSQMVEAQAFAMFGFLSLMGLPLGGKWTGAKEFGPPGQLTPGKNWKEILGKIQRFPNDFHF